MSEEITQNTAQFDPTKYLLPYQIRWINDQSPIKIWEKSRRIGATYTQALEDVLDMLDEEKDIPAVWFSSADITAAKEYIMYCAGWLDIFKVAAEINEEEIFDGNKPVKTLSIDIGNGRRINALSSSPSGFRSKGGKVVLDEYAHHDDAIAMWKAAKPSAMWGYPVRILSTHHGKGQFYKFIQSVKKKELTWSLHTTSIYTAVNEGLLNKILKKVVVTEQEKKEWLAEEKRNAVDIVTWMEEYEVNAQDSKDAFLSYELIASCEEPNLLWEHELFQRPWDGAEIGGPEEKKSKWVHDKITAFKDWFFSLDFKGNLAVGFDVARRHDLIVIKVVEIIYSLRITRCYIVMSNMPFWVQEGILWSILAHPRVYRACIDETGIGMDIAERSVHKFGEAKVEAINFSAGSIRNEMAFNMKKEFQDRSVLVPDLMEVRDDLHMMQREVVGEKIRLKAESDSQASGHADRFWALALALHAAADATSGPVTIKTSGAPQTPQMFNRYFSTPSVGGFY